VYEIKQTTGFSFDVAGEKEWWWICKLTTIIYFGGNTA